MFQFFYAILWLIAWLPLPVLYLISDALFYLVYYVARYRRKVVRKNLSLSFPDKTEAEILKTEKKFYHYFCDLMVETFYLIHISDEEMLRRINFRNLHIITDRYKNKKSVMLMTAHYCNWEWITAMSMLLPAGSPLYGIYKKLSNKNFDKYMYDQRKKFGGGNIETQELFRTMLKKKSENEYSTFGMISDQRPTPESSRHWMDFMHQDTSCLVGTEQLAKRFNYPVVFLSTERLKRGYYTCDIVLITDDPQSTSDFEITEKYMRILEQKIIDHPEFWLWTHNRWKFGRDDEKVLSSNHNKSHE